jgi:uncharacterized protein YciI
VSKKLRKPKLVKQAHLEFLDDLREKGTINMFGAAPWLTTAFALTRVDAAIVLLYWMKSFDERHSDPAQEQLI